MNNKLQKYILKFFENKEKNADIYKTKICQYGGYDYTSVDQVLGYVSKKIKNVKLTGEQDHRYCLILFGPPASGKSRSVEHAINLINKDRNSNLVRENFFELSIDDFVEDTFEWNISRKNTLKNITDIQHNQYLYKNIRSDINQIFELFMHCCLLLKLNFTLESTGTNFQWNIEKIKELKKEFGKSNNNNLENYGYNIVLMYPYTENLDILLERAEQRSQKTGRIITKANFINAGFIEKASFSFENLVLLNAKYFYIICKYDALIDKNKKLLDNNDMYVYFINRQKRNNT
jgi:hypothetical protein